jgi:predicted transcriptional regulator
MASQTASDILRLIGEQPRTSTEISGRLSLPMNTAMYHIENLLDDAAIYDDDAARIAAALAALLESSRAAARARIAAYKAARAAE